MPQVTWNERNLLPFLKSQNIANFPVSSGNLSTLKFEIVPHEFFTDILIAVLDVSAWSKAVTSIQPIRTVRVATAKKNVGCVVCQYDVKTVRFYPKKLREYK